MSTYRGLLDDISGVDGTYKQQLKAIAEGGGGGGIMILTETEGVLDKTWQEIYDAMSASVFCISVWVDNDGSVTINYINTVVPTGYRVIYADGTPFAASSANDYPVFAD